MKVYKLCILWFFDGDEHGYCEPRGYPQTTSKQVNNGNTWFEVYAPEAMIIPITPSPKWGRGNGPETQPRAKPLKRGCSPNLPALEGGTLALQGGEEVRSKSPAH
jgi:hypothetical protein